MPVCNCGCSSLESILAELGFARVMGCTDVDASTLLKSTNCGCCSRLSETITNASIQTHDEICQERMKWRRRRSLSCFRWTLSQWESFPKVRREDSCGTRAPGLLLLTAALVEFFCGARSCFHTHFYHNFIPASQGVSGGGFANGESPVFCTMCAGTRCTC